LRGTKRNTVRVGDSAAFRSGLVPNLKLRGAIRRIMAQAVAGDLHFRAPA